MGPALFWTGLLRFGFFLPVLAGGKNLSSEVAFVIYVKKFNAITNCAKINFKLQFGTEIFL